jgi:hypothetical protein
MKRAPALRCSGKLGGELNQLLIMGTRRARRGERNKFLLRSRMKLNHGL